MTERLATVEQQIKDVHQDVHECRDGISRLDGKIDTHVVKLAGRPSWAVTFLLGGLMSLVVGLSLALVNTS